MGLEAFTEEEQLMVTVGLEAFTEEEEMAIAGLQAEIIE